MKNLYIFFLIFIINLSSLNASSQKFIDEMKYEVDYYKALKKAKEQSKILMMVVSQVTCPWCRKLERQTLKRDNIKNLVDKKFIALSVDKDIANYPKKFEAKVVPSIFFINAKDETLISKVLGYKNKKEFQFILENLVKEKTK